MCVCICFCVCVCARMFFEGALLVVFKGKPKGKLGLGVPVERTNGGLGGLSGVSYLPTRESGVQSSSQRAT